MCGLRWCSGGRGLGTSLVRGVGGRLGRVVRLGVVVCPLTGVRAGGTWALAMVGWCWGLVTWGGGGVTTMTSC